MGVYTVLFVGYDKLYVFGWILDSSIRHEQGSTFCFGLGKRKALIKPIHKDYMWQSAAMHSAAQHGSMFCSFSCPHHQLNVTQCSPSWGLIRPVKLCPPPPPDTHTEPLHICRCVQTCIDTYRYCNTVVIFWICDLFTNVPHTRPTAEHMPHIDLFSKLIIDSLCNIAKAITVNGVITDSNLEVFFTTER